MDRLTYRTEDGWVGVNSLEDKNISPTSIAIHKLAEFEDLMQEQGFESLEQLKDFMQDTKNAMLDVLKVTDRWQKLKEWVIKELGYASMYQEVRMDTLDEVKDKMQELEKDDE